MKIYIVKKENEFYVETRGRNGSIVRSKISEDRIPFFVAEVEKEGNTVVFEE